MSLKKLNAAEAGRDKIVEKVIVYPVSKPNVKTENVESEIREKFKAIGVNIKAMQTKSTIRGEFNGSMVVLVQLILTKFWGEDWIYPTAASSPIMNRSIFVWQFWPRRLCVRHPRWLCNA